MAGRPRKNASAEIGKEVVEGGNSKLSPEKQAALNAALSQIRKAHGDGAIMKLSSNIQPFDEENVISSGSLSLDLALGVGGYPRGRIIEIYGPESSGKCLSADTNVLSSLGLLTIEELFEAYGHKATCSTKVLEQVAPLVNENNELENTSHFTWNGRRKVNKITTSLGLTLKPTDNHPVRVLNKSGFIVWKNSKDISVGDVLPVMRGTMKFPETNQISVDEAKIIGTDLIEDIDTSDVPVSVRKSGQSVQRAFLSSLFSDWASVTNGGRNTAIHSGSRTKLEQVQLMLLNFGYVGVLIAGNTAKAGYSLRYSGNESVALLKFLDFVAEEGISETDNANTLPFDTIPYQSENIRTLYDYFGDGSREDHRVVADYIKDNPCSVSYNKLSEIIDLFDKKGDHPILHYLMELEGRNYAFTTVTSVETEELPTFDVCLPETHSFWSNALISHNTTLTLQAIAEAQKRGMTCAFVDAEHALDPAYARKLGVDVDNLLVSQPDTGEQALEIVDTLVRSGAVDAVVVDSVAALVPRAELEGEMGDSHMGLHARLMSQSLRKLAGNISRSKCTVFFINQIRMKIGISFGSPETTTGGNSLKFYASIRLDIRRIGAIKDKETVTGNQTRVKVVKNKVAPPFRVVEFDIMYGEGISKMGEIIDLGVAAGLIEKSGSWFSYNSQRIGQGRDKTKQFLLDNPEIADEIEALIRDNANDVAEAMLVGPEGDEGADE